MPGSGQTEGELKLTQYLSTDAIDLIGDYNSDMKKIAEYAAALKSREGSPGGFATLDPNGKLIQTPSAADIGAQPQTAARSSYVKADASGNLVAGTVYKRDGLFGSVNTPRTASGIINLLYNLNDYDLIAIVTAPAGNGYIFHYTNLYLPFTFTMQTAQTVWGIDTTLKSGNIRFGYNGSASDATKVFLPAALSGFGIISIYGMKFGV